MSSLGSPNPFFIAGKKAYEIERSLRFNGADGPFLERTPSSSSNQRTMTFSFWFKRAVNDSFTTVFRSYGDGSNRHGIDFVSGGQLRLWGNYNGSVAMTVQPTQVFRDFSAWYHFVLAIDTTQGTASNRVKMYINGDQITDFATASYPSQNFDFGFNDQNAETQIGTDGGTSCNFYLAEFHEIDGFQYDPSYFGETNVLTGQWNPKKYIGSYGTNGFYLNFSDNSGTTATTLGKDSSGNSNNFTPNNFSVSAGAGNDSVEDTPTNNFCVMNPLDMHSSISTKNGNLQVVEGNDWRGIKGTFGVSSGKWYYELKTGNSNIFCGWASDDLNGTNNNSTNPQDDNSAMSKGVLIFCDNGKYQLDTGGSGTRINYSSALAVNDVLGCAIDLDNNTAQFYKQGSALGSIDISSSKLATKKVMPYFICHPFSNPDYIFNFGQQAFAYTPPTGYKALSSANLPDPTIKLPNKHFDTLLWNGNSTKDTDIAGLNFSPDWVWIKSRSHSVYAGSLKYNHVLFDTVRGVGLDTSASSSRKELTANEPYVEGNATNLSNYYGHVSAFNSDGFELDHVSGQPAFLTNMSSRTYVGWNWNAGETDGKTYAVTVVSDSGNKYRFDGYGTSAVTLDLAEGGTYIFDQSDSSNAGHPLRFSTTSNGTHGGGTEYTTGVTTAGTPGSSGAYTQIVVAASAPTLYYYCSVHSGMGGAINTNVTSGSSNFDGSIQAVVKANPTAGFSIGLFTAQSSGAATVGHGLGVAPEAIFIKSRTVVANWYTYHVGIGQDGWNFLNENSQATTGNSAVWNPAPTSSVFTSGSGMVNTGDIVFYAFSSVEGYSKMGSYTGNGSSDGTFVFLGFKPAWIMTKRTNSTSNWIIHDNKRDPDNPIYGNLIPNLSNAESTGSVRMDFLSNGFKHRNSDGGAANNISGGTYIYLAFAESPFKNARAR